MVLSILGAVILLCVVLWALSLPALPLPQPLRSVLYVLFVVLFVVWLLSALGMMPAFGVHGGQRL